MKVYLSGAPAHFISVAGLPKSPMPPLSAKVDIAVKVAAAAAGFMYKLPKPFWPMRAVSMPSMPA